MLISIFFISCTSKKQLVNKDISLELLNNEVYYTFIDSNLLLNNEKKYYEDLKKYNEEEREKAYNLLTFKIVNNSDKKYLFIVNTEKFWFIGNSNLFKKNLNIDKKVSIYNMCMLIDNKENNKNEIQTSFRENELLKNDSIKIYSKIFEKITKKIDNNNYSEFSNKSMDVYGGNHYKNSFVIYPGEYKIFKTKLCLPIYEEKDKNLNLNALIIPPQNSYEFSLGICQKKDFIWNSLLDYQKKEIKDNHFEIFDGVLVSNKVPLKMTK